MDDVVRVVEVIHTGRLCEHAALLERALDLPALAHVKRRVLTECRRRLAELDWQDVDIAPLEGAIFDEMTVDEIASLVGHLEGARKPIATRISLVDRLNIFSQSRDERRLASLDRKLALGREALARRGAPAEPPPRTASSESEARAHGERCRAVGVRIGDLIGVTDPVRVEPDPRWDDMHPDMCLEILMPPDDADDLRAFQRAVFGHPDDHLIALRDELTASAAGCAPVRTSIGATPTC